MPTFPTLGSGSASVQPALEEESLLMYPATTSFSYATRVYRFDDCSEQRWTVRGKLRSVEINYSNVNGYDFGLIAAFFEERKGRYSNTTLSNTFTMTILGEEWLYCVFDQDSIEKTVGRSETYSFTLRIKQVRPA